MRLRSVPVVVILVVALAAIAAGCGGGGKKAPTTRSTPTTTASSNTTTSSGSGTSFANAQNCQQLAGIAAKAEAAIASTGGGTANTLKTEANVLQGLANAAPSDIRSDFETMATAFSSFVGALEKAGYKLGSKTPPTPAQIAALTKAAKSFDTTKVAAAEKHLTTWAHQNCKGVHLGG